MVTMLYSFWQICFFARLCSLSSLTSVPVYRLRWSSWVWVQNVSSVYNKHACFMTKRLKYTKKPPWLSKEIEEAMHQRDSLLKARKHEEFKKQRSKVTSLIRASKKTYFPNWVASKYYSRCIWKAINIVTNKNVSKSRHSKRITPRQAKQ